MLPRYVRSIRTSLLIILAGSVVHATMAGFPNRAAAQDVSPAPILQWFESTYATQETRTADAFMAGYGAVWFPPPGRADSGNQSVGYDVFDRFDLGRAGSPTLYGTETGLKKTIRTLHRAGLSAHSDLVLNHNGFTDASTTGFLEAGGYPGFVLQDPDGGSDPFGVPGTDGDFHSPFETGDLKGRLSGLIDINHSSNHLLIRHPVDPADSFNIPSGTTSLYGRLANAPSLDNRRFYPDRDAPPMLVFDPATGESDIPIYSFNTGDPTAGDPVPENVTGMLMRNAQWLVQDVGFDGFRIDAAKHFEPFVLNYLDRAIYRSNPRTNLDGSTQHVFSYSEVFDGDLNYLQTFVRKDIDPADLGRVGGNRDALDFAQYFALKSGLTNNGAANDWNNIIHAGMDYHDDTLINGSSGVTFVVNHDDGPPDLNNVAHAYLLMRPGNTVVYYNAKEHGTGRDFPKDGRGDALGNYGDTITKLVEIRNTHGRGDYRERWVDQNVLVYERSGSALVALNNRNDAGFDERRVDVDLPWGTPLVELTGNAAANADIPELAVVDDDFFQGPTRVTLRSLRNDGADKGYLVYGLASPRSSAGIELTNVDSILPPTALGGSPTPEEQARARLTPMSVITSDSFSVTLQTTPVTLHGTILDGAGGLVQTSIRDRDADGDAALLRINEGLDLNGNGMVDHVAPGSVSYGFEAFTTSQDGFSDANGNGFYQQTVDATLLPEGMNFITARAFRHRNPDTGGDGGPAVYTDFKQVIYVDRLPPESAVESFDPVVAGTNENRTLAARSLDQTANNIHILHNLGAAVTDAEVLAMLDGTTQGIQKDRDLWTRELSGVVHGNHAVTLVSFEPTGNSNIQRTSGLFASTVFGSGLGDIDHDNAYGVNDIDLFEEVLFSDDRVFNPAADLDGNGLVNDVDRDLLGTRLVEVNADSTTQAAYQTLYGPLTWSADGVTAGGSGTWQPDSKTWIGRQALSRWRPERTAAFGGVGGTVAVDQGGIALEAGLEFTAGYVVTDGVLTLNGPTPADNAVSVDTDVVVEIRTAFDGTAGLTKTGNGTLALTSAMPLRGPTTIRAGTLALGHADALANSPTVVAGGRLEVGLDATLPSITVGSGSVALTAPTRTLVGVEVLAVEEGLGGGLLDLGKSRIDVVAGGISAEALRADIIAGRNGGSWDGATGITSTAAAADPSFGVGYTLDASGAASVAWAALGDSNLDGLVNFDDILALFPNYDQPGSFVWQEGDFTYDGLVNFDDILALFPNYNQPNYLGSGFGGGFATAGSGFTGSADDLLRLLGEGGHGVSISTVPVPEPSTDALAVAGLIVAALAWGVPLRRT